MISCNATLMDCGSDVLAPKRVANGTPNADANGSRGGCLQSDNRPGLSGPFFMSYILEYIYYFETVEFGKIECDRRKDGSGVVYFFRRDEEYDIDNDGYFQDFNGLRFRVHWPSSHFRPSNASLEVFQPRMIARVDV